MEAAGDFVTVVHPSGEMHVPVDAVMQFTTPMWGMEVYPEFALLPAARRGIWWFIATGEKPVTFVLADPFIAMEDYAIDLSESERDELGLEDGLEALVLILLTMPTEPGQPVSGNFKAPLVFNLKQQKVLQVINRDERYLLSGPVNLAAYELEPKDDTEIPSAE